MRHCSHEIINVTGVRISSSDVRLLPVDVADSVGDVSADDVISLDLLERQVWVVDSDERDAGTLGFVYQHSVVKLRNWNFPFGSIDVQVNVMKISEVIFQPHHAVRASVNVENHIPVSSKLPRAILYSFPAMSQVF